MKSLEKIPGEGFHGLLEELSCSLHASTTTGTFNIRKNFNADLYRVSRTIENCVWSDLGQLQKFALRKLIKSSI